MRRILAIVAAAVSFVFSNAGAVSAAAMPPPLAQLRSQVSRLAARIPGAAALEVLDLSTGYRVGYNAGVSMPAASTIKVPVMVEVFRQLSEGRFNLQRKVTLLARDKDWGSGELCDASVGSTHTVAELLSKMIDISDNTATNMLIRLVGRSHINQTMDGLGLEHTRLHNDVRTAGWSIRQELRSSPADMVRLLSMMARHQLVDEWSSNEMISILEDDQFNTLLPASLPDDVTIAHKTGSLFDTLNDVGIVYADQSPYVIAVMTTGLGSLSAGRSFIHTLSKLTFASELRLARWRDVAGISPFSAGATNLTPPDVRYWENSAAETSTGGGR
jgi:beta-lactamase class A